MPMNLGTYLGCALLKSACVPQKPKPIYGPCCARYQWIDVDDPGDVPSNCTDAGYFIPQNITDNVAQCLLYNDALRLEQDDFMFLTQDLVHTCAEDPNCKHVLHACEWRNCSIGPCTNFTKTTTVTPSKAPSVVTSTPMPSTTTKTPTTTSQTTTQSTYPMCEEVATKTERNIPQKPELVDNRQLGLAMRAVIAYKGSDPRSMKQATMPFIGQIVFTLTDATQHLDGWLDCDGSEIDPNEPAMSILAEILGGNRLPDCHNRALLHMLPNNFGKNGGENFLNLSEYVPHHSHNFNLSVEGDCDTEGDGQLYAELSAALASPTKESKRALDHMQEYVGVQWLVTAKEAKFKDDPSRLESDLIYGELVAFAGTIELDEDVFYACDGRWKVVKDAPELAMEIGSMYGAWDWLQPFFELPDCTERLLVHSMLGTEFGDEDALMFGTRYTRMSSKHIGTHRHPDVNVKYEGCELSATINPQRGSNEFCVPITNVAPSLIVKYGAYHGRNDDTERGHFLGSVSLFAYGTVPPDFLPMDGALVMSEFLAESVSDKYIVSVDRVLLPVMSERVAVHSNVHSDIGEYLGTTVLGDCSDFIGTHKHVLTTGCMVTTTTANAPSTTKAPTTTQTPTTSKTPTTTTKTPTTTTETPTTKTPTSTTETPTSTTKTPTSTTKTPTSTTKTPTSTTKTPTSTTKTPTSTTETPTSTTETATSTTKTPTSTTKTPTSTTETPTSTTETPTSTTKTPTSTTETPTSTTKTPTSTTEAPTSTTETPTSTTKTPTSTTETPTSTTKSPTSTTETPTTTMDMISTSTTPLATTTRTPATTSLPTTTTPIYAVNCSQPIESCTLTSEPVHNTVADSRQRSVGAYMYIATEGMDPRLFSKATVLTTPFVGQLIMSLTDKFPDAHWTECDGSVQRSATFPQLAELLTGNILGKFKMPDCNGRVLVGGNSVTTGGSDTVSFEDIYIEHSHEHMTQLTCDSVTADDGSEVNLEANMQSTDCDSGNGLEVSRVEFDNRQKYLSVFVFIVARGRKPWARPKPNDGHLSKLVTGEVVYSVYDLLDAANGNAAANSRLFVACDGSVLSITEFPQLFAVVGLRYSVRTPVGYFKIPDCKGRALRHVRDDNQRLEIHSGAKKTVLRAENVSPHFHSDQIFHLDSAQNCDAWLFSAPKVDCIDISNVMPSLAATMLLFEGNTTKSKEDGVDIFKMTSQSPVNSQFPLVDDILEDSGRIVGGVYTFMFAEEQPYFLPLYGYMQSAADSRQLAYALSADNQFLNDIVNVSIPDFSGRLVFGASESAQVGVSLGSDWIHCDSVSMKAHRHNVQLHCEYPTTTSTALPTTTTTTTVHTSTTEQTSTAVPMTMMPMTTTSTTTPTSTFIWIPTTTPLPTIPSFPTIPREHNSTNMTTTPIPTNTTKMSPCETIPSSPTLPTDNIGNITSTSTHMVLSTTPVLPTNAAADTTTDSSTTPVVPSTTPVVPSTTPVVPSTTPVVPSTTPVVPSTTPVIISPTQAPVVPTTVAPTLEPVVPTTAPTVPTTATIQETQEPCPCVTLPPFEDCTRIHGGWTNWSVWSACRSVQFGDITRSFRYKTRECTAPQPSCGGCDCKGESYQAEDCRMPGECVAEWAPWHEWSNCVVAHARNDCLVEDGSVLAGITCKGFRVRTRTCLKYGSSQVPDNCECDCRGALQQVENCQTSDCFSIEFDVSAMASTHWVLSFNDDILEQGNGFGTPCVPVDAGACYSLWLRLGDSSGSAHWRFHNQLIGYHKPAENSADPFERNEEADADAKNSWLWAVMDQPHDDDSALENENTDDWSMRLHKRSFYGYVEYRGCIPKGFFHT